MTPTAAWTEERGLGHVLRVSGFPLVAANEIDRWIRKTPWRHGDYKRDLGVIVKQRGRPHIEGPATVCFIRCYDKGGRLWDDDNLRRCFKAARDALIHADCIVDDSPKWLTAVYDQQRKKLYDWMLVVRPATLDPSSRVGKVPVRAS